MSMSESVAASLEAADAAPESSQAPAHRRLPFAWARRHGVILLEPSAGRGRQAACRPGVRALALAEAAGRAGGSAPAVLNAANEVAVDAFLGGRLGFLAVTEIVEQVLDAHRDRADGTPRDVADVLAVDAWARGRASALVIAADRPARPSVVAGSNTGQTPGGLT
jgi:hypothetical protein